MRIFLLLTIFVLSFVLACAFYVGLDTPNMTPLQDQNVRFGFYVMVLFTITSAAGLAIEYKR